MFWTCRYPLARLVHDCNSGFLAGKPRTCRPLLLKGKQKPIIQSSFYKSSYSLPTEMKLSFCLYRRWFHVFHEGFNCSSSKFLTGTRHLSSSSSPSWYNSFFQLQDDNVRTKNPGDVPLLARLPQSLIKPAQCPRVVSSSPSSSSLTFTSLILNSRIRPFTSHSLIDAKFYGTQTNNNPDSQDTTSTEIPANPGSKSKRLTADLKEDIQTIPNLLTCCRMASAPFLSYLVLNGYFSWALGLFVCAGITDLLDGYIARNFKNQNSMLGTALDPFADKILISFLTVSLTAVDLIPLPLLLVIIGRDLGLVGICFYIRYVSLPPPKTMKRYFDVTHATAEISPTFLSKVNTAVQLSLLALSVAAPVFGFVDHILLQALWYVTASTTVLSACGYVRERNNVVKILGATSTSNESKK